MLTWEEINTWWATKVDYRKSITNHTFIAVWIIWHAVFCFHSYISQICTNHEPQRTLHCTGCNGEIASISWVKANIFLTTAAIWSGALFWFILQVVLIVILMKLHRQLELNIALNKLQGVWIAPLTDASWTKQSIGYLWSFPLNQSGVSINHINDTESKWCTAFYWQWCQT